MLKKEDAVLIEMSKEMTPALYSTLNLLYLPLIGKEAYLFYTTLLALKQNQMKITNHILLQRLTGMSIGLVEKARGKCEEFQLMRTFYKEETRTYLYVLDVPMKDTRFLSHEVFGRLFLDKMGDDVVTFYKSQMQNKRKSRNGFREVSATISNTIQNNWDYAKEKSFQNVQEEMEQISYDYLNVIFDEKLFLSGLSDIVFPKKQRTKKNLRIIAEIATIYGINETMMKSLIAKGIVLPDKKFSAEKLRAAALSTKAKYIADTKDPFTLPPRRYLEYRQNGVPLGKADVLLIEKLMKEYHLQPEVINVLLETCLKKYNQKILGTTVERMAASWLRLKIETIEQAKEQMKKECEAGMTKANTKAMIVQEWEKPSLDVISNEEEKMKMIEEINKMRGDK